jgi:UDP-glucuronate 4-epimerase
MRYLITGGAGFIGSHLTDALLARGDEVVCFDNFNDYYNPARKRQNIAGALNHSGYTLVEADLRDAAAVDDVFQTYKPTHVAHLGAMANPRASVQRPLLYEEVNVRGTMHILDAARRFDVQHHVDASTTTVYGLSPTPWSEDLPADRPLSPYAATKRSSELLAYTFHQQYGVPTQVVRFFTVYGPRGRPDMTPHLFVNAMVKQQPITLFNGGIGVYRDWTYIDDIVAGVTATLDSNLPFETINLGNSNPTQLRDFIEMLEEATGLHAQIEERPLSAAEPPKTFANIDKARRLLHFEPRTQLADGLAHFWDWYQTEVLHDA